MTAPVTIAIPTLDAGPGFQRTLVAIRAQRVDREVELLVCDSGSSDRTVALARAFGARVIEIDRRRFSHGGTRNRLVAEARGAHVAFLTQDAVPAQTSWLADLLSGFALAPDVGLVFGPYRPSPGASVWVRRELEAWFSSLGAGAARVDRLPPAQRAMDSACFYGPLGFFTDANGCVARGAWRRVPFREVAYAEDHLLAQDMLRAGYAKVYVPAAAVEHSHEYTAWGWLRRGFDEARAVREVYGVAPDATLRAAGRNLRGDVGADWRAAGRRPSALVGSAVHHGARSAGALLGARATRLPAPVRVALSLERRR